MDIELNSKLTDVRLIIVDGTEQRKNRPKNKEKQKKYYSGKKMPHGKAPLYI